jgi:hypothetical protein
LPFGRFTPGAHAWARGSESCGHTNRKDNTMSNKPTLYAYAVKDRGRNRPSIWTKIGAAWPHEKGSGFTLELDALPVDGRIVLTEPKPDEAQEPAPQTETEAGEGA